MMKCNDHNTRLQSRSTTHCVTHSTPIFCSRTSPYYPSHIMYTTTVQATGSASTAQYAQKGSHRSVTRHLIVHVTRLWFCDGLGSPGARSHIPCLLSLISGEGLPLHLAKVGAHPCDSIPHERHRVCAKWMHANSLNFLHHFDLHHFSSSRMRRLGS